MHDWNVKGALQALLDIKAFGCLDVLQVDAAKGGGNLLHCFTELLRVFLSNFDVEHVDATIDLEQQSLAFHHGFAAQCSNVAKAKHGSSIADNRHQVALVGIAVGIVRMLLNL